MQATLLLTAYLSLFLLPQAFSADSAKAYYSPTSTLGQGDFELTLRTVRTLSDGRFDQDGNLVNFEVRQDYQRFEYQNISRYGISPKLELKGGINYRKNFSWDANGLRSDAKGPQYAMVGARYSLNIDSRNTLVLDTELRQLFNTSDSDQVELGDRGRHFRFGATMTTVFSPGIYLNGSGGIVIPGEGQSVESDFDLSLFWDRGPFAIGGGIDGVFSFGQDDYSDNPQDKPRPSKCGISDKCFGSTNTINSIDRSYYRGYGAIYLGLLKDLRLELLGARVLGGNSWDQQYTTQISLIYRREDKKRRVEQRVQQNFKGYDVDAMVLKVSPKGTLLKIDKGLTSDIEKGMRFDIYETDYHGKNVLLATGRVYKVASETAIIKILKVFNSNVEIKQGHTARGKR